MIRYKINDRIDKLTIIGDTGKRTADGGKVWLCLCDCGNTIELSSNAIRKRLLRNNSCDCGCGLKKHMQQKMTKIIPIGTKFLHFVIKDGPFYVKRHVTEYEVEFDNGEICRLNRASIRNNPNQCCSAHLTEQGRLNKIKNQKTCPKKDQRFGKLTVIDDGFIKDNKLFFTCKCDCGNICYVSSHYLNSSALPNCGCIKISSGEQYIQDYLIQQNIDFKREFVFDDLIDIKHLRFDFAVFQDDILICLIEYNGKQHYLCNKDYGWNNQEQFKTTQKHDNMKKVYCEKNNIPLIIIPYTINGFEKISDLLKEKLDNYF